jgi:hypothetical protein
MDDFREQNALRQTISAMGNAAAQWIKESSAERARLLDRINRLECALKLIADHGGGYDDESGLRMNGRWCAEQARKALER